MNVGAQFGLEGTTGSDSEDSDEAIVVIGHRRAYSNKLNPELSRVFESQGESPGADAMLYPTLLPALSLDAPLFHG